MLTVVSKEGDFSGDPEKTLEQQAEEALAKYVEVKMACGCPALVDPSYTSTVVLSSCSEHTPKPSLASLADIEGHVPLALYLRSLEHHLSQYGQFSIVPIPQTSVSHALAIAQDPESSTELLEEIFNDYFLCASPGDSSVLRCLAQSPGSSSRVLSALHSYFPELVAQNPACALLDLERPGWQTDKTLTHLMRHFILASLKK